MKISIETRAVCALDQQIVELYRDAQAVTLKQQKTADDFQKAMRDLSNEHERILAKIVALDVAIFKMLK